MFESDLYLIKISQFQASDSGTQEKNIQREEKKEQWKNLESARFFLPLAIHNLKAETKIDSLFRIDDVTKTPAIANRPLSMY